MQEKKRKKKKSTAEQEEQTKKMQSVAETASEQPTAEEPPKESAQKSSKSKQKPTASGSANTKENRRTGWILAEVAISAALLVAMRLTLLHPFLDNWTEVNTMSGSTWLEDNAQQVPLTTTTPDSTDPTGTTDSNKNGNQSDLYKSVSMDNQEIHNGDLILVNNSTAYESTDENELEAVYEKKTDSYSVSGSELMLRGDVIDNLNHMLDDFQTETGHSDIIIISGYRTTEQQQELYDADLEDTGEDTSTLVAKPDTVNMKLAMPWTFHCLKMVFLPTMTAQGNMTGSTKTVPTMGSFCGIRKIKPT